MSADITAVQFKADGIMPPPRPTSELSRLMTPEQMAGLLADQAKTIRIQRDELVELRPLRLEQRVVRDQTEWPEPVDVLRTAAAVPFTDADLPQPIGDYAMMWSRAAGFDSTASVACALVATAAAIDDHYRLEVSRDTGWYESARLWAALLTPPGGGKTPAIRENTRKLRDTHRELVESYARAISGLADDDERPPRPALFTNDCTIEKLSEVLADNPRGLLYLVEEFDSWIGGHDAYRANGGGRDRGEWLQLFDGGPHQVDRIRRGSFFVPNWGVSLLSACTPSALKRYASKLPNDGLLQRVLPFMVRTATARCEVPGLTELRDTFDNTQRRLLSYRPDAVAVVPMTDDARQLFEVEAAQFRELALAVGGFNESLAGHVAKYGALLARLALVNHAIETPAEPSTSPLQAESVALAARFLRKSFGHARSFYAELGGADKALSLAQAVGRFLVADTPQKVERRELIQRCRAFRDADSQQQTAAMQLLADCGWVVELPSLYQRPHPTHWTVNPRTAELFAADGEAHRQRRQLVREAILSSSKEPADA